MRRRGDDEPIDMLINNAGGGASVESTLDVDISATAMCGCRVLGTLRVSRAFPASSQGNAGR